MSNKTFYWILAAVAIVIIIIAVISIKNSNKGAEIVPLPPVIQYDGSGNPLPSPTPPPVSTPPVLVNPVGKFAISNKAGAKAYLTNPFAYYRDYRYHELIGIIKRIYSGNSYLIENTDNPDRPFWVYISDVVLST